MIAAWKRKLGERQDEIAQKYYEEAGEWLTELYSTISEVMVQDFMSVYNEMLSTLGEKQKPAPADLYKLDSYWELQKKARVSFEDIGRDIYAHFNSQLRLMFVEIYESIAPDDKEKTCTVSEEKIQELINKPWGRKPQDLQERIWIQMTVLWDKLFGHLMYSIIKNIPTKDLEVSLQEEFSNSRNSLVTLFSDKNTHLRAHSALHRYKSDRKASPNGMAYFGSYINTYGNAEEIEAYNTIASAYNEYAIAGASGEEDEEEEEQKRNEEPKFEIIASHGCEPCSDLDGIIWDEGIYGDVPVPVHPNCCCDAVPYEEELSMFGRMAGSMADAAFGAAGGGLTGIIFGALIGAAFITLGVMVGDDYSTNSSCSTPGEWLKKWGDRYPV